KEGKLKDPDIKAMELINAQRSQELAQLGENIRDERAKYYRLFKQWFNGEIRYLNKLEPYLQKMEGAGKPKNEKPAEPEKAVDLASLPNQFCPRMETSVAIEHFSKLVKYPSGNGKPFLTERQLSDFIGAAFCHLPGKPKIRINCQRGEYGRIRGLFYDFYNMAVRELHEPTPQCKHKYVNLLCDHFEGFEARKVSQNFRSAPGSWK
ncbi:MAG: hypothetical protein DI539_26560, partial [Flavobacterium psychrophilum]